MASGPRPLFVYPPSIEFLLRRSLRARQHAPAAEHTDYCISCGVEVAWHTDPRTGGSLSCADAARRARQERES